MTPDHVGCPCCVFEERCLYGGSGIACYGDRWGYFSDGPCWPSVDAGPRDSGPPDAGATSDAELLDGATDASVSDGADPVDDATDASDPDDAAPDDAADGSVEDGGSDGG